MNNLLIKRAALQNLIELQQISQKTFLETYASGNTEEDMKSYLEKEFSLNKLKRELSDEKAEFHLATTNGEIIGYLKINFGASQTEIKDERSLEIQRIYVLKEFQGRKIGQSLYQRAVEIGKQRKLDYIWLGVWEENPKAIQFYERLGFVAFDKHIFRLGDDEQTDIMMQLEL